MSIAYPLNFPTITGLVSFTLRERAVVGVSASPFSGAQQVQEFSGQWWEAEFSLRPLTRDLFNQWSAFFSQLHGRTGTFLMGDPLAKDTRGSASIFSGSPALVNGGGQIGTSLSIKTTLGTQSGFLKAGDKFSLGTGTTRRMHKTLYDVDLVAGNAVIEIWPRLRYSPANNAPLYFQSASTQWRLATNLNEHSASGSDGGLHRIPTVSCVEAL